MQTSLADMLIKSKGEYISPSVEEIPTEISLNTLTTFSLDGNVEDYEGDELEDF